jgi:hypothetical protein
MENIEEAKDSLYVIYQERLNFSIFFYDNQSSNIFHTEKRALFHIHLSTLYLF